MLNLPVNEEMKRSKEDLDEVLPEDDAMSPVGGCLSGEDVGPGLEKRLCHSLKNTDIIGGFGRRKDESISSLSSKASSSDAPASWISSWKSPRSSSGLWLT